MDTKEMLLKQLDSAEEYAGVCRDHYEVEEYDLVMEEVRGLKWALTRLKKFHALKGVCASKDGLISFEGDPEEPCSHWIGGGVCGDLDWAAQERCPAVR